MIKRGVGIIFLFVFAIFLLSFVSSASCSITSSCSASNMIMKLSSTTNAHGALYNQGAYTNYLCCDFTGTHTCSGSNKILGLSATTNAHAEIPSLTNYGYDVCFGTLSCTSTTSSSCPSQYPISMLSLSSTTNAHLAQFSSYGTKICCKSDQAPICGNGIKEGTEQCDDGNINNGDGCSSTCVIETSPPYTCDSGSPTCCYQTTPTTSWQKNGVTFSGGNIAEGDILTMTINDDLCLASGTPVVFNIYKNRVSYIIAGSQGISNGATNTISATYTVNQGFLDAIGTTSNIFFQIASPIIVTSSSISVTPLICNLTSASWNQTSAVAGQPVKLNIVGTNCNGKTINFQIWKYNFPQADSVATTNPSPVTMISNSATGTWTAEWNITNPSKYYFIASVSGMAKSIKSSTIDSLILKVTKQVSCPDGTCNNGETCSTCPTDCGCSSGYECYSGSCALACVLSTPVWNMTNAIGGQKVQARVSGTNCNGYSVSFAVIEDDSGPDDSAFVSPSNVIMNSNLAIGTWTAEWPDREGELTPEYYFIAGINALGKTINSSKLSANELHVTQNFYCGDGIITSPEECDGAALGGATCVAKWGAGWTGTPHCNSGCTLNFSQPYCVPPPVCTIVSATWNTTTAVEGESVKLNIQTAHCNNGESVSFIIKENDHSELLNPDDNVKTNPNNALISSNSTTGTWIAEWQDDKGGILSSETNPPEYYFTAKIVSNGRELRSSTPDLNVTQRLDAQCSAVGYCVNYLTQTSCEADACNVGKESVPSTISCTGTFNSETGCYDYTDCGCSWNNVLGQCGPSWNSKTSCQICGNTVRDYGEQCDDGNTVSGDGCSSTCQFEATTSPCPLGLALCSDGTCSLNCKITDVATAACNYNGVCESTEGCTCSDCNGLIDTCEAGLICNINNAACCSSLSDGVCNPYCSYVDPDCAGRCGNGFKETGEECDLGIRNSVTNSGCTTNCKYEIISGPPCPEGTNLCNDGTCSLNCYATDKGIAGCETSGTCESGLTCSPVDMACCNAVTDGYCNEYCAYMDPDCVAEAFGTLGANVFSVGICSYTETGNDTCEGDNLLVRSLTHSWNWSSENSFSSNQDANDYWQPTGSGVFRYDPLDFSGVRKSAKCVDVQDTLVCPASVQVPFFGIYSFVGVIIIVILIYILYSLRKEKNSKKKRKK